MSNSLPIFGLENSVIINGEQKSGFLCYLIVSLQIILRLPGLKEYVELVHSKDQTNIFFDHLLKIFKATSVNVGEGKYNTYQLNSFTLFYYECIMPNIEFGIQQDAHECINSILNKLLNFKKCVVGSKIQFLKCMICGYVSKKNEPNTELIVNIPFGVQNVTLEQCIKSNFNSEHLKGDNCWNCPKCNKKVETLKSERLTIMPNILIVVLNRFKRTLRKDTTLINIPLDTLLLENKHYYQCIGIISHLGSTRNHGHYIAYCRINNEWYLMNDNNVFKWNPNKRIISDDAYILVYKLSPIISFN